MIFLKLIVLDMLNLELLKIAPYKHKYSLAIPWFLLGLSPNFQLPQIIFDFQKCRYRNPVIKLKEALSLMIILVILVAVFIGLFLLFLTCIICGWRRKGKTD